MPKNFIISINLSKIFDQYIFFYFAYIFCIWNSTVLSLHKLLPLNLILHVNHTHVITVVKFWLNFPNHYKADSLMRYDMKMLRKKNRKQNSQLKRGGKNSLVHGTTLPFTSFLLQHILLNLCPFLSLGHIKSCPEHDPILIKLHAIYH